MSEMNRDEQIDGDILKHQALFEQIRKSCLSFPGTSERESHGAPTFFLNEKKSFVQYRYNHHGDGRIALWCAAPSGIQAMLVESEPDVYFVPPYVGYLGWVGMRLDRHAAWSEITGMLENAYLTKAPPKYKEMLKNSRSTEGGE
jgi:hypothetical protein